MEQSDLKRFAILFYGLAEEYGGQITKNGVNLKFEALKEYTINDISKAASWIVKNRGKTFPPIPTVQEFQEVLNKLSGNLEGKAKAELECDKVLQNLKYWGRECPTVFKDKTTQYLMTSRWTFHQLGMMKDDDLKWWRKDFIQAYKEIDEQDVVFLDVAEKAGMIPANNLKKLIQPNTQPK